MCPIVRTLSALSSPEKHTIRTPSRRTDTFQLPGRRTHSTAAARRALSGRGTFSHPLQRPGHPASALQPSLHKLHNAQNCVLFTTSFMLALVQDVQNATGSPACLLNAYLRAYDRLNGA